jgi:predicted transcriptional regulator
MASNDGGLTDQQRKQIEQFLHLFSAIEQSLKRRLKLKPNDPTGFGVLVKRYLDRNPYWTDSAHQLWLLADIRNLLTHNRNTIHGYPVIVTKRSVQGLETVLEHLMSPVDAAVHYRKPVTTVAADDTLGSVVVAAYENGFSQFPVVSKDSFVGLITENEIARWLGRKAKGNGVAINLNDVAVKTVLREKDPFRKGIPIFKFVSVDSPIEEVMGLFAARPMLEAVFLSENGHRTHQIEGIITQWDAARYPN